VLAARGRLRGVGWQGRRWVRRRLLVRDDVVAVQFDEARLLGTEGAVVVLHGDVGLIRGRVGGVTGGRGKTEREVDERIVHELKGRRVRRQFFTQHSVKRLQRGQNVISCKRFCTSTRG
jgi:hypothetical protein